ncbi:MAG: hypothetical protein IPM23_21610 [Candidatus Melainabacteria bacterium]|nr:hypothetical protein [Candidatus Melainabacteria bacterium]
MTVAAISKDLSFLTEEQKAPAFSFFFRVHSGSEKQLPDAGHMRSKCHEVIKEAGLDSALTENLLKKADHEIDQLDLSTGARSVGIYVSPDYAESRLFYTFMPERQYRGEFFSCLETLYAHQESSPYVLFHMEPRNLQVFRGRGEHLELLAPSPALESLERAFKHRDTLHADKDGKTNKGEHSGKSIQEILDAMAAVCTSLDSPAAIAGLSLIGATEEDLRKSSIHAVALIDEVQHATGGGYLLELGARIMELSRQRRSKEALDSCNTAAGAHRIASQIDEMLAGAREGRAEALLLQYPSWEMTGLVEFTPLHDTARETLSRHGRVEFLSGGLEKWGGQVMLLRY